MSSSVVKHLSCCLLLMLLSACKSTPSLTTVDYVDPDKFSGDWYVISNIPYFAERNKVDSKATYRHIEGNRYEDIFTSREGSFSNEPSTIVGTAKSLNENNTLWKSTFFWVIRFKFAVIFVDEDYELMLLGHRSRNYGWVMARSKSITDQQYRDAMQVFSDNGYDISKFIKVPQFPDDIGKLGFQLVSN